MIRRGDIVTFKPEWRDPGDEDHTHFAAEDEDGGRVLVAVILPGWAYLPSHVVCVDMIESPPPGTARKRVDLTL